MAGAWTVTTVTMGPDVSPYVPIDARIEVLRSALGGARFAVCFGASDAAPDG